MIPDKYRRSNMARKAIVLLIGFFVFALMAPQLSHAESMLTWDSIADAQGYKIYYGTSKGRYIYSKDVGNVIKYPLANFLLDEGTEYFFVVRAYNDAGESDNSSESSYTVPSPGDTTPPLAPQGVASGVSDVNITLSWKANTESDLSGYKVYYGNSSRSYSPSIPAGNVTSYTVDNLEAGKTYYLAVSALDSAANESGYSLEVVQTIPSADGGAPPSEGPMLQWDSAPEQLVIKFIMAPLRAAILTARMLAMSPSIHCLIFPFQKGRLIILLPGLIVMSVKVRTQTKHPTQQVLLRIRAHHHQKRQRIRAHQQ
jgi:hypothetical protein